MTFENAERNEERVREAFSLVNLTKVTVIFKKGAYMKYGLHSFDVENIQRKINKQKDYMENSTFMTSNGTCKTLLDVSMSANISERYYAQLVNKVNTLQQAMTNLDLTPVFLTITHDGWLHDLYYGDYSRFEDKNLNDLPESDRFGYFKTKAHLRETFTVHDIYQIMRWKWEKFIGTTILRKVRETSTMAYLFATEPHESGVPHAHVLVYVPHWALDKLKKEFVKIFNAPMNITQDKKRLSPEQIANGELNGFQWTISNPVGYILKYVTKSFMDIKNQAQIDELQAWYIKHRIVRFTTSHTLVPQWVYNKVYPLENDWLYLSDLKINSMCEWSAEDDYFKFEDTKLGKTLMYNRGLYQMFQDGQLVHEFGEYKEKVEIKQVIKYTHKYILKEHKQDFTIKRAFIFNSDNQKIGVSFKRSLYPCFHKFPTPSLMSDSILLQYYYSLDIEKTPFPHYQLTQNECINRCLIKGQIHSLNQTQF